MEKYSYEVIKNIVEEFYCKLLTNDCKGVQCRINVEFLCGHIGTIRLDHFIKGIHYCESCAQYYKKQNRHSFEHIKDYIEQFGCKIISTTYERGCDRIKILYPCNHIYDITFESFRNSKRILCPNCVMANVGTNRKIKYVVVKECFESNGFILDDLSYVSARTKINFHDVDGYKYYISYDKFKRSNGIGLSKFHSHNPHAIENIKNWLKINNSDIIFSKGVYSKSKDKNLMFKCSNCLTEFISSWGIIQMGTGCIICNMSKGERKIMSFLIKNNINFIYQYPLDDCRHKLPLPFDFAILENNKKVLVEFDGEQHYLPKEFFGGESEYKKRKKLDQIKNDYCQNNNIDLIRIPYWEINNIEKILSEKLDIKI